MTESEKPETSAADGLRECLANERTFLANERTFLAWFRTAMTLIALGLAVAQFLTRDIQAGISLTRFMAILLIGLGAFIIAEGLYRYRRTVREIEAGQYRPSRISVVVTTVVLLVVAVLAAVYVLTVL